MNIEKLRKLAKRNEVRLDAHLGHKRVPPFYYDSLRNGLENYFNTFHTLNSAYDSYAEGLSGRDVRILKYQFLDEDNTVLTIVNLERFLELFLKNILLRTNRKLTYQAASRLNSRAPTLDLVNRISNRTFISKKFDNKSLTIPFRETITRVYELIDLVNSGNNNRIVKRFKIVFGQYPFLISKDYKASMELLNWYRDRILHNGNRIPSMWLLDYLVTQRFIPMIQDIVSIEINKLGNSLFYFKTPTGIDIIERLGQIKFAFKDLKNSKKKQQTYFTLLYIGQLKELGRASLNMGFYSRNNWSAGHEYNYRDPKGRGRRFALAERRYSDFKTIKNCICCGEKSMVHYSISTTDPFNQTQTILIDWLKCYTCDYHLRYNAGDPYIFGLSPKRLF
jgi:hypothetical protein